MQLKEPDTITSKELESNHKTLTYSLLGVINMETAVKKHTVGEVLYFMNNQHPNCSKIKLRPLIIETIKEVNGEAVIFAFFIPVKEKNPHADRVLLPESFIAQYRQDNPIIEFNDDINNWTALKSFYLNSN